MKGNIGVTRGPQIIAAVVLVVVVSASGRSDRLIGKWTAAGQS